MGVKITDMTAASSVAGTELIPTSKSGAPRTVTPAQIKTYVVDEIEAISAGVSVAAGNGLFALQSGVLKPVDIDLVCQRAIDTVWGKAADTPVGASVMPVKVAGVEKTVTVTVLAGVIRGLIESTILDLSDLSTGTIGASDYMLVTQGTTPKKITVQALYDAVYAAIGSYVAGRTEIATPTNSDMLLIVRGTTAYQITLEDLATYVAAQATLTGTGTAGFLAEWSGTTALTTGPSIAEGDGANGGFGAGANTAIPTTLCVREELNTVVYDQAEIGAALVDADTVLVNDGDTTTTQRKSLMSRVWTYILAKITALTSLAGFGFFLDEDAMTSDSATKVPSQQSVKAYVDAAAGGNVALTRLLINGATDIGAALADGDELGVYDLSVTTNRKSAVSRLYTYIQSKLVFTDVPITSGTDIGAAIVDGDEVLLYDASATANRKSAFSRIWTYVESKIQAVTSLVGYGFFLDEDNMASDSATKVPSQQSVKAYVDAVAGAGWDGDIADVNLDGGTDIGEALAGVDLILVDNGAAGVNRKCAMSRVKTFIDTVGTYKTLWIPAAAMTPSTTAGATAATVEYGTNYMTHDVLTFPGATADSFAEFDVVMPEGWDLGTIKYKAYWTNGHADANAGEWVNFYLSAGARSNDDALDAVLGTAIDVLDQHITDDDVHVTAASAALTVGGTPALGDLVHFKVGRDYDEANGGTAMDVNAYLLGILIQYRENAEVAAW